MEGLYPMMITAYIVPGFEFDNWIAAVILGFVNAIVRPIAEAKAAIALSALASCTKPIMAFN
jgi:uncharacterized membrane protein YvlD (DUF360 family)